MSLQVLGLERRSFLKLVYLVTEGVDLIAKLFSSI
jgi:hypothetical protein